MAAPSVPRCRAIREGTRGIDVVGVKRAGIRAGLIDGEVSDITPVAGPHFMQFLKKLARENDIEGPIKGYGPQLHQALVKTRKEDSKSQWAFDDYAISLMKQSCEELSEAPDTRIRQAIKDAAMYWNRVRDQIDYSQDRPFPMLNPPKIPDECDCSGFVSLCHFAAGAKNPNNRRWDGLGYTGTLMAGGKKVAYKELKIGDAVFYGFTTRASPAFPYGSPTHVALFVGGGMVVSHGQSSGPSHYNYRYRSDLNCYVTYDVT
jgi:hypothetical protein